MNDQPLDPNLAADLAVPDSAVSEPVSDAQDSPEAASVYNVTGEAVVEFVPGTDAEVVPIDVAQQTDLATKAVAFDNAIDGIHPPDSGLMEPAAIGELIAPIDFDLSAGAALGIVPPMPLPKPTQPLRAVNLPPVPKADTTMELMASENIETEFNNRVDDMVKVINDAKGNIHSLMAIVILRDGQHATHVLGSPEALSQIAVQSVMQMQFKMAEVREAQQEVSGATVN